MRTRRLSWLRRMVSAGGVLVALGVGAAPALGGTYTLNLSAPSATGVGQPMIIQATGSNPPDDFFYSWFSVHAIPTSVLSTCPADQNNAFQIASSTSAQGGEVVTNHQREDVDAAGNFSMPVAHTPRKPGRFLLCGYTDDGATTTLAAASLALTVEDGSSPTTKPGNLTRPRVTRAARRLVCSRGSWSNNPSTYSYSWLVNGKRKRGATRRSLAVTRGLRGRRVQCRVTASNAGGAATAVSRPLRIR